MTKNRARKRATKNIAADSDVRRPAAAYLADHRKLRTTEFGVIDFAEGPLRLLGTDEGLAHFRPLEVVLKAAEEKRWRVVQLAYGTDMIGPDMLAYLRGKPTLTMIVAGQAAPGSPFIADLLAGAHKDLNVVIQGQAPAQPEYPQSSGRAIFFGIEDGIDPEPIPPRITGWYSMEDHGGAVRGFSQEDVETAGVLCGTPASTEIPDDFAAAVTQAMRQRPDAFILSEGNRPFPEKVQLAPGVTGPGMTNALVRSFHEATFATGENASTNDDRSPRDEAPFSLITGPPGAGRTAAGWARIEAADAALDALRIPQEAQEFCTYPDGMFLITGTTGTGKTTTGLALMRRAQVERGGEAFVVMRPGEALGPRQGPRLGPAVLLPVFGEGEYPGAIREAVERGAEILFVDGLHGRETIKAAVDASLSGVLVFATMHSHPEDAVERLQDAFQSDGAAEAHARVRQAVRGVIGVQLVDGEGPERRALAAEVWVKGDEEEATLEPVLTFAESRAAVAAKFAAIRAGSDTGV